MIRILLVLIMLAATAGAVVAYGDPARISAAGGMVTHMLRKASAGPARSVQIPRAENGEFTLHARSHPTSDQSGFDRYRAGAAKWIQQRLPRPPTTREQHRGSQRLPHGSLGRCLPIPSFVQQHARAVRTQRDAVVLDPNDEELLASKSLVVFQRLRVTRRRTSGCGSNTLREPLRDSAAMVQRRFVAADTKSYLIARPNKSTPREVFRATLELGERVRMERCHAHHYP